MTDLADDAGTVTSELAANAVAATHGAGDAGCLSGLPVIVLVLAWQPAGVRIEIWDTAPGTPRLREPDWQAESGRGLFIVNALTRGRWGCRTAGGSKCVWADITRP